MTDNMREVWDAHDKARNKAWREEPGTFDTLDAFKAGAAWQAAKSVPDAELDRLRKDAERPDCTTCANRGRVNGLSQETYCEGCVWHKSWRSNHYSALAGEKK